MQTRHLAGALLVATLAVLAGAAWVHARMMASDDRPPIIVRGGSIYFQGGDPNGANETDCCNNWKRDLLSDEWKPDPDDKQGVKEYAVTVTGVQSCSMTGVTGAQVLVYFQYGDNRNRDFSLYRFNVHAKFGLG